MYLGETTIQLIKSRERVNIVINAYDLGEQVITTDPQSFAMLVERFSAMANEDEGHDLFSIDRYVNDLPPDEEEDDND